MTDRLAIWAYCILNDDDLDVVPNAFNSLARCGVDKIIAVDGGTGSPMIQRQRNFAPIREWLASRSEWDIGGETDAWNGVPLVILYREWDHPAGQRNFVLSWIGSQPDKCDWIVALDSDEIESTESERGMWEYLASLPDDVTNVVQPLLSLAQDERHCAAGQHSTWLAHSRLHRTGAVSYRGQWHEHQNYTGKRVRWDARIIHERMLFRRRIYLQRGAYTLRGSWKDLEMVGIPSDVHWTPLEWPKAERIVPFDDDIRPLIDNDGNWID